MEENLNQDLKLSGKNSFENTSLEGKGLTIEQALVKTININGENFDVGSDWHLPLGEINTSSMLRAIKKSKGSDVFFCVGDLFTTSSGEDSSNNLSEFLSMAAEEYPLVVFIPGNHDLRGREDPFDSIAIPEGVYMPKELDPLVLRTEANKILLGNIFYDLKFIDPAIVDTNEEKLKGFYPTLPDGQHLLNGDLSKFPKMSASVAKALDPTIDILVTHVLPHPSLVTFRVEELTPEIERMASEGTLKFICDPEGDRESAKRWDTTPAEFRNWWNEKSFFMGSNVLEHPEAQPKDGLTCVYGHNHRTNDDKIRLRNGNTVRLLSYQQVLGRD